MKKINWEHIKLIAIQWVIFVMAISAYALYTLNERNQELRQEKAELEQENKSMKNELGVLYEQYNQPSVIYRMEKK